MENERRRALDLALVAVLKAAKEGRPSIAPDIVVDGLLKQHPGLPPEDLKAEIIRQAVRQGLAVVLGADPLDPS
jgi:hypothetical protein